MFTVYTTINITGKHYLLYESVLWNELYIGIKVFSKHQTNGIHRTIFEKKIYLIQMKYDLILLKQYCDYSAFMNNMFNLHKKKTFCHKAGIVNMSYTFL